MRVGVDTTFLVQASIREHPGHGAARAEMAKRLTSGDRFVMAPQVVAEFIHVVTDPRRFMSPLSMAEALQQAQAWWQAQETEQVVPTPETVVQFWRWMAEFNLGRKRLLDTMLAATYATHNVHTVLSGNARDYGTFGCFHVIVPE